jgi:hypothetical protein
VSLAARQYISQAAKQPVQLAVEGQWKCALADLQVLQPGPAPA